MDSEKHINNFCRIWKARIITILIKGVKMNNGLNILADKCYQG